MKDKIRGFISITKSKDLLKIKIKIFIIDFFFLDFYQKSRL